jgi:thioredoxin 1
MYNKDTIKQKGSIDMAVLKVTKDNFAKVRASEKPVLLDFYADWCGPCQMVSPVVDEIAEEHSEYTVGKINVDQQMGLAEAFGVSSIPMLVVMKNGQVTANAVGARPKSAILDMLKG